MGNSEDIDERAHGQPGDISKGNGTRKVLEEIRRPVGLSLGRRLIRRPGRGLPTELLERRHLSGVQSMRRGQEIVTDGLGSETGFTLRSELHEGPSPFGRNDEELILFKGTERFGQSCCES